ncbi:acyl-CoA dehydrogenase family protein [Chloroflexota bacterium]
MEFELNEQQSAIRTMVRKFAREYIKPITAEIDNIPDPKDSFPWEMFKAGSKLGLKTIGLPEKYGGHDEDLTTQIVVSQELGYADAVCAKMFTICWRNSRLIYNAGTEEQRQRFLSEFRDDDTYIIAAGLTEAEAGCDNILPYNEPDGGLRLSAVKKGDGYVLSGTKHFASLGNVAKLFLIAARTDKSVGVQQGTSFFLVPRDVPGFSVDHVHNKFGLRAYTQAALVMEDVYLPKENLLGGVENVDAASQIVSGWGNLELGVHALSIMEVAYDAAFEYAKIRVQGGKPIIEHQVVASTLADMYIRIETARGLIRNMVRLENQQKSDRKAAIIAKVFNSESAVKVAIDALEMFGGSGVMKELPLEKYVRDALTFLHLDGTCQVNRLKLGNMLKAEGVPAGTGIPAGTS